MGEMILHRGANEVDFETLREIPTPEPTDSFYPIAHHQLATKLKTISCDLLRGHELITEKYAIARNGGQFFCLLSFKTDSPEMNLSIAARNSTDKSMSVGLAIGSRTMICDNMALRGDVVVLRKHTKNIWNTLEDLAITTLYRSQQNFAMLVEETDKMKEVVMVDDDAYKMAGWLYGHGVLSPRQMPVAIDQWHNPRHDAFKPRNLYSFYQDCTEALKSTAPANIMEAHVTLHQMLLEAI